MSNLERALFRASKDVAKHAAMTWVLNRVQEGLQGEADAEADDESRAAAIRDTQRPRLWVDKTDAPGEVREGWRLLDDGNAADALMVGTTLVKNHPDDPHPWSLLIEARAQWSGVAEAISDAQQALQACPNYAPFYYNLGCLYHEQGDMANALDQYERAFRIDPRTIFYRVAVALVWLVDERHEEAIELLEEGLAEELDAVEETALKTYMASMYLDVATAPWWRDGGPSRQEQVARAEEALRKARGLGVAGDNPDLDKRMEEVAEFIGREQERKFNGCYLVAVSATFAGPLWMMAGVVMMIAGENQALPAIFGGAANSAMGAAYIVASRARRYRIANRPLPIRVLKELALSMPIIMVLPIVIWLNWRRNYENLGELKDELHELLTTFKRVGR